MKENKYKIIKQLWLIVLVVFISLVNFSASAQCVITMDGAVNIDVPSGTFFGVTGDVVLQDATSSGSVTAFDNKGTVHITGNFTNNGAVSSGFVTTGGAPPTTGTCILEGAAQSILGSRATTFFNLTLAGSGVKTLSVATATVKGTLNLADREFATGTNTLILDANTNVGRTTGWISSLAGGFFQRNTNTNAFTYDFPVGEPGGRFRPFEVTPATVSVNSFKVRLAGNTLAADGFAPGTVDASTLCNPLSVTFYHRVQQTSAQAATLTMYFASATDGSYYKMAHWQNTPRWEDMSATLTAGSYYGTMTERMTKSGWSDFTYEAFALANPTAPTTSAPTITNATVCSGSTTNFTTNVATVASGGSGVYTYQWQYNNGGTWGSASNGTPAGSTYTNSTSATMTIAGITGAGTYDYRCIVSQLVAGCPSVTSGTVTLTVVADPAAQTVTANPVNGTTICLNSTASATFSGGSGGTGTVADNYFYNNGSGWVAYTPGNNITFSTAGAGYGFRTNRTATGSGCDASAFNTASYTVNTGFTGGSYIYTNPTACTSSNGTLTITPPTGSSGSYNYSITSTNGVNGTWQASASFTGIANSATGTVWARDASAPSCPLQLTGGTYTMRAPFTPITAATAAPITDLCANNIVTLIASNMAPGNGGNGGSGAGGQPALPTQGAFTFNGSTQYLSNASSAGLPTGSNATIEAWVKPSATQSADSYIGICAYGVRGCTGTAFGFGIQQNRRLSLATWCNDFVPSTGPALVANVWSHVACVINGTSVQFYINGQLAQAGTIAVPNISVASGELSIGRLDATATRYFNGSIDNVRIWAASRTQGEIQSDMYKDLPTTGTVSAATLRANYLFNLGVLTNNGPGAGPNLGNNGGTGTVYPANYTYTWDAGYGSTITTYEQLTVGPLTGINNYQVTATQNPTTGTCPGTASTLGQALISDFTSTPFTTSYPANVVATTGVTTPGTLVPSGANQEGGQDLLGRPGGVTRSFSFASNFATGQGACTNYGLPTTLSNVLGMPVANTTLRYSTASPTNLPGGIVAYTGTMAVPAGYFFETGYGSSNAFNWPVQLIITVKTSGGAAIPGDYVSSGDIMFRITGSFTVKVELKGQAPGGKQYDGGMSGGFGGGGTSCSGCTSCATIAANTNSNYYAILDVYDCLAAAQTTPSLTSTYTFDNKFPRFNLTPAVSANDISICSGGNPASKFIPIANVTAIPLGTNNCGGFSQSWTNSAGTVVASTPAGTWSTPTLNGGNTSANSILTTSVTLPTTYTYTVASGATNICYASKTVNVTARTPVADPVNFPAGTYVTTNTTTWTGGVGIPAEWDPPSSITNDNWFDNRNWSHCVPTSSVNALINYVNTNQPQVTSNSAAANGIKTDTPSGAKTTINTASGGKITVTR